MGIVLCFVIACFALLSCTNHDQKTEPKRDGEVVFADYRISGDADKEAVTLVFRFRRGEEGDAFLLSSPAQVALDGEVLVADSVNRGGTFYEAVRPAASFSGSHRIRYTDNRGKTHEEGFVYEPFRLAQEFPAQVPRQPFTVKLASFPQGRTLVQLVMADTSFASPDVNEDAIIENGELQVTAKQLSRLTDGPVIFEIYRDEETPVAPNGRLVLSYGLRRQFELTR